MNLRVIRNITKSIRIMALPLSLLLGSSYAYAEYLLQSGDVVELIVSGIPELRQRQAVDIDGDISFPLLGDVPARGLPVSNLRQNVVKQLSSKIYQQRTSDGRDIMQAVMPEQISLSVVEYRPIYLNGDVTKPGEQPFRHGLTVRQAISVAGGYDVLRFRTNNPILESADLRAEYQSLWTDYAREQAQLWRLQIELGDKPGTDPAQLNVPIAPDLFKKIVGVEREQLKMRSSDVEKERASLQSSIDVATTQLDVLAEKQRKDQEGYLADAQDHEKVREMAQRGLASNNRISETRRAVLLSSTQVLQTVVEVTNLERQRNDYRRQLERLSFQHRSDLLKELQDTNVKIAQTTARLQSVGEKLLFSSTLQSQLVRGSGGQPQIRIFRAGESQSTSGDEDTELRPGDTVTVMLKAADYLEAPVR